MQRPQWQWTHTTAAYNPSKANRGLELRLQCIHTYTEITLQHIFLHPAVQELNIHRRLPSSGQHSACTAWWSSLSCTMLTVQHICKNYLAIASTVTAHLLCKRLFLPVLHPTCMFILWGANWRVFKQDAAPLFNVWDSNVNLQHGCASLGIDHRKAIFFLINQHGCTDLDQLSFISLLAICSTEEWNGVDFTVLLQHQ